MTDIVERLRQGAGDRCGSGCCYDTEMLEAADEIERLKEALEEANKRRIGELSYLTDEVIPALRKAYSDCVPGQGEENHLGYPHDDPELAPCPLCGGEVYWATPNQILCRQLRDCGAMFSFSVCSVESHARRLFSRRVAANGDVGMTKG